MSCAISSERWTRKKSRQLYHDIPPFFFSNFSFYELILYFGERANILYELFGFAVVLFFGSLFQNYVISLTKLFDVSLNPPN